MKRELIILFFGIFLVSLVSALPPNDLHLNLEILNSSSDAINGTFDFNFTIYTSTDCSTGSVYSKLFSSQTTDKNGKINFYLTDTSGVDFTNQLYLGYYRDSSLKNCSKIPRVPYSNSADVLLNSSNQNIGDKNITSTGSLLFNFIGSLTSRITTLFVGNINATGNIETSENISGAYIKGDASLLSNLPSGDGNASSICSNGEYLDGSGTCINFNNTVKDLDTNRTDTEIKAVINNSDVSINCDNINFSGTYGSASICDGSDDGSGTDTIWGINNSDIINQSGNLALNRTTLDAEYVGQNEYANLDTDSTDDLTLSDLPLANRTLPNCANITGATSNLCTLTDTDTTYSHLSNFTDDILWTTSFNNSFDNRDQSGGNNSFNQSLTGELYSDIKWGYNQTDIYTAGSNITIESNVISINITSLTNYFNTLYQVIGSYLTNNTAGWTLNFSKIYSDDWSNVTITESQITDLTHTTDTNRSDADILSVASVYNDTSLVNGKLDATDQRYNETGAINGVNTTTNIENLGFVQGSHTVIWDTTFNNSFDNRDQSGGNPFDQSLNTTDAVRHEQLNITNIGTSSNDISVNIVSRNPNESAVWITGNETGKGTLKIAHTKPTEDDSSSAGLSIDLQGVGTSAQGVYISSTGNTSGDLIHVVNYGENKFQIDDEGNIITDGNLTFSDSPLSWIKNFRGIQPLSSSSFFFDSVGPSTWYFRNSTSSNLFSVSNNDVISYRSFNVTSGNDLCITGGNCLSSITDTQKGTGNNLVYNDSTNIFGNYTEFNTTIDNRVTVGFLQTLLDSVYQAVGNYISSYINIAMTNQSNVFTGNQNITGNLSVANKIDFKDGAGVISWLYDSTNGWWKFTNDIRIGDNSVLTFDDSYNSQIYSNVGGGKLTISSADIILNGNTNITNQNNLTVGSSRTWWNGTCLNTEVSGTLVQSIGCV